MYKLRTIDVWDTMLRRSCHPDCSKLVSARHLALVYKSGLHDKYRNFMDIYLLRCAIERDISESPQNTGGEYSITEVMEQLVRKILPNKPLHYIQHLSRHLIDIEFDFEIYHTYPDYGIESFIAQYPAELTMFLSDFYMPRERLTELLAYHGLNKITNDGFSSCDIGLNKRTGSLFKYVHEFLNISAEGHVHIGDNHHSDVNVPKKLGINGVLYEPKFEQQKREQYEVFFRDRQYLLQHVFNLSCEDQTERVNDFDNAYRLGRKTAVLFVGFILFIAEHAISDGIKSLHFLTREGEFFYRVWNALFDKNILAGVKLPNANLLEVSRLSTFTASLREVSTSEMMRVWNLYSTQSMAALFITLGISPELFKDICQDHGLDLEEKIQYPWQDKRVKQIFADRRFLDLIEAKIKSDRLNLLEYLEDKGFYDGLKIGIVDIGWRGTIQDNLAYLRRDAQLFGYYMGLNRFLNEQPENVLKYAFGPNINLSNDDFNLLSSVSVLEMLCNSPSGSVSGYKKVEDDKVKSVRVIDEEENIAFYNFTKSYQDGVVSACILWSEFIQSYSISSHELRTLSLSLWHDLLYKSEKEMINAYNSLNHNEMFGLGGFVDKRIVPSVSQIIFSAANKESRSVVVNYVRQNQFPKSAIARRDVRILHRFLLWALLYYGNVYKRWRNKWRHWNVF